MILIKYKYQRIKIIHKVQYITYTFSSLTYICIVILGGDKGYRVKNKGKVDYECKGIDISVKT